MADEKTPTIPALPDGFAIPTDSDAAINQSTLKSLSTSLKSKLRGLATKAANLKSATVDVAVLVVQARLSFLVEKDGAMIPDLQGRSKAYRAWYKDNVDVILSEHVPNDEDTGNFLTPVRRALKHQIQEQLRLYLRETFGREKADRMLAASDLDPLTNSERNAARAANGASETSDATGDAPREQNPSDVRPASDAIYPESQKEAAPVLMSEAFQRLAQDLAVRVAATVETMAMGDKRAILSHCNAATDTVAIIIASLGTVDDSDAEQVAPDADAEQVAEVAAA